MESLKRHIVGYKSVGMVEFIVDTLSSDFNCVKMNTQLKVTLSSYLIIFLQTSTIMLLCNLAFKDLLHQNLFSNPFIQKYITNIEKPNPTHELCVLSSSIVKEILVKINISERPFSSMDVEPFIQNLSLLLTCVLEFFTILIMPLKLEN